MLICLPQCNSFAWHDLYRTSTHLLPHRLTICQVFTLLLMMLLTWFVTYFIVIKVLVPTFIIRFEVIVQRYTQMIYCTVNLKYCNVNEVNISSCKLWSCLNVDKSRKHFLQWIHICAVFRKQFSDFSIFLKKKLKDRHSFLYIFLF